MNTDNLDDIFNGIEVEFVKEIVEIKKNIIQEERKEKERKEQEERERKEQWKKG